MIITFFVFIITKRSVCFVNFFVFILFYVHNKNKKYYHLKMVETLPYDDNKDISIK